MLRPPQSNQYADSNEPAIIGWHCFQEILHPPLQLIFVVPTVEQHRISCEPRPILNINRPPFYGPTPEPSTKFGIQTQFGELTMR